MSNNTEHDFELSSGNVFADLGLPDADVLKRPSRTEFPAGKACCRGNEVAYK